MRELPQSGTRRRTGRDTWSQSRSRSRLGDKKGTTARPERLSRLLQAEIIPRLMLVHRVSPQDAPPSSTRPNQDDVAELTRLLCLGEPGPAQEFIEEIYAQGITTEAIFLDLFAPSALLVGELWAADRCTFTDVTISLSRLQYFVRKLSALFEAEEAFRPPSHIAIFAPAPGEQHVFGLMLVEEFFRRAGWDAICELPTATVSLVRQQFVTMIGFSAGDEDRLDPLAALITQVRAASQNSELIVMVGGTCFIDRPELVGRIGADTTAKDAREALTVMRRYLETKAAANELAEDGTRRWMRPTTRCDSSPLRIHLATSTRKQRPK